MLNTHRNRAHLPATLRRVLELSPKLDEEREKKKAGYLALGSLTRGRSLHATPPRVWLPE